MTLRPAIFASACLAVLLLGAAAYAAKTPTTAAAGAAAKPAAETKQTEPAPAEKPAAAPAVKPADAKPAAPPKEEKKDEKKEEAPKIKAGGKAGAFSFDRDGDTLTVEFSTGVAQSAAIFVRSGQLWIVVTQPGMAEASALAALPESIGQARLAEAPNATALRIRIDRDALPFVTANDNSWKVIAGPASITPRKRLAFNFPATGNAIDVGPYAGEVKPMALKDPDVGDTLTLLPLPAPATALAPARDFVDISFLATGHGIAYAPRGAEIAAAASKGYIRFTSARNLYLSPHQPRIAFDVIQTLPSSTAMVFLPWKQWDLPPPQDAMSVERRFFEQTLDERLDNAAYARLRLAQLFAGEGFYYESLGMLGALKKNYGEFYAARKAAALRGVTNFMLLRVNEAVDDFKAPEIADSPETEMWLNICGELLADPTRHFEFLAYNDKYIKFYPAKVRQKLALIGADLYITRKDYASAKKIFEGLAKDKIIDDVQKSVDYLQAKIYAESGQIDLAIEGWEKLAQEYDDRFIRARSEFSLVNLLLQQNRITRKEAIRRLDAMRIVWRGDSLELNLLSLLGNLYLEEKDYIMALRTLFDLISYYPNSAEAISSARKMADAFIYLFNQGGADLLAPLEALALYREFVALTPIGEIGDRIIQKMAERLVKADLLDQAGQLLQDQINSRLQKQERSEVGARLALIHLMNRKAHEALDALELTGYGQNPLDLEQQRAHIAARAFAALGEYEKGLTVLEGDTSDEGQSIRMDIYWSMKDWKNVINMSENKLGNRADPTRPLTPDESHVLIRLAVAYTFENDTAQLQYLKDYFEPLMKQSPDRATFEFITQQTEHITPANFNQLTKDIESIQNYLRTYRERVMKEGLAGAAAH